MSKAMLVIDMPESCKWCDFGYYSDGKILLCSYKNKVGLEYARPDWCPLKPVPEEQLIWHDDERSDWERGYNNCLCEIVGK